MPKGSQGRGRGSSGGHKGQRRHFTNPDQLAQNKEKEERERRWREQRGELSSGESEEEEEESSSSESSAEEAPADKTEEPKAKGVQHLIEIENPNRIVKKDKKISEVQIDAEGPQAPQLSRREREEIEKQKAKAHYQRMHAAGRTAEAKEDLARLAIIRKQREEAAKKREEEHRAEAAKSESTKKSGKKT